MKPTVGAPHPSCATGLLRRAVALLVGLLSIGAGAPAITPLVVAPSPNSAAVDDATLSVAAPDQAARRAVAGRRRRLSWVTRSLSPRRVLDTPLTWFAGWSWRWEPTLLRQRRGPPLVTY